MEMSNLNESEKNVVHLIPDKWMKNFVEKYYFQWCY